jgi:hypothetical protein
LLETERERRERESDPLAQERESNALAQDAPLRREVGFERAAASGAVVEEEDVCARRAAAAHTTCMPAGPRAARSGIGASKRRLTLSAKAHMCA